MNEGNLARFRADPSKVRGGTICGHERQWLLIWLDVVASHPDLVKSTSCTCGPCAARNAIFDPVTLAAIMAEALRERGFAVSLGSIDAPVRVFAFASSVTVDFEDSHNRMLMPKARVKLLAVMRTPADPSSREACERILKGES